MKSIKVIVKENRSMRKELDSCHHQLQIACGALRVISQMDEGCNFGSARAGFKITGYVAAMSLIQIEGVKGQP